MGYGHLGEDLTELTEYLQFQATAMQLFKVLTKE